MHIVFISTININFVCPFSWLVESPSLSTSHEPNGTLYVNQSVSLNCTATLSQHVDTSVTVVVTWTGPRGFLSNITMETQETYSNTVPVNALQTSDSGSYTCSAIASPDVSSATRPYTNIALLTVRLSLSDVLELVIATCSY